MKKVKLLQGEFYDRTQLREDIYNDLSTNKKVILVRSSADVSLGLTYLMMYLHDECESKCIYIDMASDNNLSRNLYNTLKNEPKTIAFKLLYALLKVGASFLCLLNFPVTNLSFALGGAVQKALEETENICSNGKSISKIGKVDLRIIKRRSKKKIFTIIIDNADIIGEKNENRTLITKLLQNENLKIILGAKETSNINKLYFFGDKQQSTHIMSNPEKEYIDGIVQQNDKNFTDAEKEEIISQEHDVYKISNIVLGHELFCFSSNLTASQEYIIKLIRYSGISLNEKEIVFLASIISTSQTQVKRDLELLLKNNFIEKKDNVYIFNKLYNEKFIDNELYYVSIVTDYFYMKYQNNPLAVNEITLEYLIRNLRNRYPEQLENVKLDLLQRAIRNNFTISADVLNSMEFENSKGNLMLSIILFNLRKYKESRQVLEKVVNRDNKYEIMNVLLLNRERDYEDTASKNGEGAISRLRNIINNNISSEYYALFNAVYAVSLLHADKMSDFDELVENIFRLSEFSDKPGAGYFFRNVAFSVSNKDNKNVNKKTFRKADEVFNKLGDEFGVLTNRINFNTYKTVIGELEYVKEEEFRNDVKKLTDFGVQHLHVALNNLSLFYILRNYPEDTEKARIEIEKAKVYAYDDMPKVFTGINDALLHVRNSDFEKAYDTIIKYEKMAHEAKFTRIKQKYYITKGFIAWLNNNPNTYEILEIAKKYPERRDNNSTFYIIEKIKRTSPNDFNQSDFQDYILPAYLEYWYINPLKFINVSDI